MKAVIESTEANRPRLTTAAVALVAMLVGLVLVPKAPAASDPIAGGMTSLHMKKGFLKKLANNDIDVRKTTKGVVQNGRSVFLDVTGDSIDPTNGEGTIEQLGGFKLKVGRRAAAITNLSVQTGGRLVRAKVANARMRLGFLGSLTNTRDGFGLTTLAKQLKLSGKAAKRISNKLGLKAGRRLNGGRVISNLYSATQPSVVTVLPQGNATLVPERTTFAKFGSKGINPFTDITPIAPAQKQGTPPNIAYTFPIDGGQIAPDASSGTVSSGGGMQITRPGGATVQFTNLGIDFTEKTVLADSTVKGTAVGRSSIATLDLSGATIRSDSVARTVAVSGAVARLQTVSAALLNQEFPGGTDFAAGDSLGTVSFTAQTQ